MKKWVNTAMEALKNSPLRDNFESLTNHSMPSFTALLSVG
jgi:hypothetical protein